jgi:hypothetical protein
VKAQSQPERAHYLRLILLDDSHCTSQNCSLSPGQGLENYYSFHYVLDDEPGWKELQIRLQGNADAGSPFWRTGGE